jgi:hypothetical protein
VNSKSTPREIIFEFHRIDAYVKVSAADVATGEEVSIIGDAKAPKHYLERLARDKLLLALKKKGLL